MTPNKLIQKGSNFLKLNNIKSYMIDSELILSSVSGKLRENFLVNLDFKLNPTQIKIFKKVPKKAYHGGTQIPPYLYAF